MNLSDALRLLVRRWYIIVAGIIIVVGAAFGAIRLVPTEYEASGQVLLLLPSDVAADDDGKMVNPYVNLSPGLNIAASVIASNLNTPDTQKEMFDSGFRSDYAVGMNPGTGPLLTITVSDVDSGRVVATRDEVIKRLGSELLAIQSTDNLPENQMIQLREYAVTDAQVLAGSKIRALAVIMGAGLTITLIVAFMFDRFMRVRANRSGRPEEPATQVNLDEATQTGARKDRRHSSSTRLRMAPEASRRGGGMEAPRSIGGVSNLADRSRSDRQEVNGGQYR